MRYFMVEFTAQACVLAENEGDAIDNVDATFDGSIFYTTDYSAWLLDDEDYGDQDPGDREEWTNVRDGRL